MASSSSSKGSLLPFDILESILCKVPAESLNRFKSVCKKWFNMLKDKRFVYNHLDLVQQHFIHLSETLRIINPETNEPFSKPFPNEFHVIFPNFIVMHCDGLLLSITENSPKLFVWNPIVNQVRWISTPDEELFSVSLHTYGFGYDSTSRDNYKIIFWFKQDNCVNYWDVKPTFEIYEFKSDCWRTLDTPFDRSFCYSGCGVSVKGNMYWISLSQHMSNKGIGCFDFSTETFKSICPLPCYANKEPDTYAALSAYREDKLSLIYQHSGNFEVWITNNVEDKVISWIKLFAVSSLIDYSPIAQYFIDKNNRINFVSSEVKYHHTNEGIYRISKIHIIGKDGFQTKEFGQHRSIYSSVYVFLPSLVLVPLKRGYV